MRKGIFTISLDFELFWGVRDHRTLENYGSNIRNVHKVVPRLLQLFEKYGVHCTWATVGFLFMKSKEELLANLPAEFPQYVQKEYDPYGYIQRNELDPVYHFAPALIDMIKKIPGQEVGTHTFSHFYTLEKNTTLPQFREDLRSAIKVAKEKQVTITSIVFPRNQYSTGHISVCKEFGITVFRGNEVSRAYRPLSRAQENIFRRAVRFADTFINVTGHHCHPVPSNAEIIDIPASRFLRPFNPQFSFLDTLKFNRIKNSLKYAAQHGLIYQLWWHPHNFGSFLDENFSFLEKVLKVYSELNHQGKMESLNLSEIYLKTGNTGNEN